jgi:hypothetical protein
MAADWTWLIYMAGDNNLEESGHNDLEEMQKVGSTDQVNIIVQFDTEENETTRYRIKKGELESLQTMPGVDCGDPEVLADFIKWGTAKYPANHYLVGVWNHGGGWENLPPDFDYERYRSIKSQRAAKLMRIKQSIFRSTVKVLQKRPALDRAIAIDCGSKDYLDNQELRKAFEKGMQNGRKFDIFACDACLMNMIEIAYEMKDTADIMVGSEESEPLEGWPYEAILGRLVANPDMTPEELAKTIVVEYKRSYENSGEQATQSALDLRNIIQLAKSIDDMSFALLGKMNDIAESLAWSRMVTQHYEMHEYIDLGDFARNIAQKLNQHDDIKTAAEQVQKNIDSGFVMQNAAVGYNEGLSKGVSIYFPSDKSEYAPDYNDLLFSIDHKWNELLEGLFKMT